jgi:hypothetical protein
MGAEISKTGVQDYGFAGVQFAADKTEVVDDQTPIKDAAVIGLISTGGDPFLPEGLSATGRKHLFSKGVFIQKFELRGPQTPSSVYGTITVYISATNNNTSNQNDEQKCIEFPMKVYVSQKNPNPSQYMTTTGDPPSNGQILTGFSIHLDNDNNTVIGDVTFGNTPQITEMTLEGSGAVGFLEDRKQGFNGIITGENNWQIMADADDTLSHDYKIKYFDQGFILQGLCITRAIDAKNRGISVVELFTSNFTTGQTKTYRSWQAKIIPYEARVKIPSNSSPYILRSFQYFTIEGTTSLRKDFLLIGGSGQYELFVPPQTQSTYSYYSTQVRQIAQNHGKTALYILGALITIVVFRWIYVSRQNNNIKKELRRQRTLLRDIKRKQYPYPSESDYYDDENADGVIDVTDGNE